MDESAVESGIGDVNSLPLEILNEILCFLKKSEKQMARAVCQIWKISFDIFNEIHVELTNHNWRSLKNCSHSSMNVTFHSLTRPLDLKDSPTIDFLHRVRIAEFTEWIVSYNLATLMKHCVNLESLALKCCQLDIPSNLAHMEEFKVEDILLPKLKTLKFNFLTKEESLNDDEDHLLILLRRVLANVNFTHFELREELERGYQYTDHGELISVLSGPRGNVNHPIARHLNFLTSADILEDHMRTIHSLTWNGTLKVFFDTNANQNSTWPPQIQELEALCEYYTLRNLSCLRHLTKIKLREGDRCRGYPWYHFSLHVETFSQNLTDISIYCNTVHDKVSCDCMAFRTCASLRKLIILARSMLDVREKFRLKNCHLLPASLRILKTHATPIYTGNSFRAIPFENLERLEELHLCCEPYFELSGNDNGVSEMNEDTFNHLLESLPNLNMLKLKFYENKNHHMNTCHCCGQEKDVVTTSPSLPEEFVHHVKRTPGLLFTLNDQFNTASISVSPEFRNSDLTE